MSKWNVDFRGDDSSEVVVVNEALEIVCRVFDPPDSYQAASTVAMQIADEHNEVAELRERLQLDYIGTHSDNCWDFGRKHYGCALGKIAELRGANKKLQEKVDGLEDRIDEWEASSLLENQYGDSEGITPDDNETNISNLNTSRWYLTWAIQHLLGKAPDPIMSAEDTLKDYGSKNCLEYLADMMQAREQGMPLPTPQLPTKLDWLANATGATDANTNQE